MLKTARVSRKSSSPPFPYVSALLFPCVSVPGLCVLLLSVLRLRVLRLHHLRLLLLRVLWLPVDGLAVHWLLRVLRLLLHLLLHVHLRRWGHGVARGRARRPRVGIPELELFLVLRLHASAHGAVGKVRHAVQDVRDLLNLV